MTDIPCSVSLTVSASPRQFNAANFPHASVCAHLHHEGREGGCFISEAFKTVLLECYLPNEPSEHKDLLNRHRVITEQDS